MTRPGRHASGAAIVLAISEILMAKPRGDGQFLANTEFTEENGPKYTRRGNTGLIPRPSFC
jgi:hypothetical protein